MRTLTALVSLVLLSLSTAALAQDGPKREITRIAGDLYRFQNNFHVSVFLVTDQGVLVTDPINAEAATWLRAEIAERFNQPVRYLVYSHDHRDHSAGGEVFADEAIVVAHENAKSTIIGEKRPTAVPDVTFNDRMTIELGGKKVHLIYPGRSHSDNLIVMHFPAERAVFAVDFIAINRVAYLTLPDAYFPDWIDAIKAVEAIDFDILVPGHGPVGKKADATRHREYLEAVYDGVLAAVRRGESLEQIQQSIDLSAFSDFGMFEKWGPLNVEGMYNQINMHRRPN